MVSTNYYEYIRLKELRHSGLLGMKWGLRRFRNKDGTLTEAGKERYYPNRKEKSEKAPDWRTMSNEELTTKIDRMTLQKKYIDLYSQLHPDKLKRVKKFMADMAETLAKATVTAMANKLVESSGKGKKKDQNNSGGGNSNP